MKKSMHRPVLILIALAALAGAIGARVSAQATPPPPHRRPARRNGDAATGRRRRPRTGTRRRRVVPGTAAAARRSGGDRARQDDLRRRVRQLPWRRSARRPVERSESAAIAARAERPGGRADPADRPGRACRKGHAGAADSARRREGDCDRTSTASPARSRGQGAPPRGMGPPPDVLVGDAAAGATYFGADVQQVPFAHGRPAGHRRALSGRQGAAELLGLGRPRRRTRRSRRRRRAGGAGAAPAAARGHRHDLAPRQREGRGPGPALRRLPHHARAG